jgi:hypothetical protein
MIDRRGWSGGGWYMLLRTRRRATGEAGGKLAMHTYCGHLTAVKAARALQSARGWA